MRLAVDTNVLLSGLFFHGNERRLLMESFRGRVTLVFSEDVVDEAYRVLWRFRNHAEAPNALPLLESILRAGELVDRDAYRDEVGRWASRVRGPTDAPILAAARCAGVDGLVTGDRDILEVKEREGIRIYRAREALAALGVDR